MHLSEFEFELPAHLIAQEPLAERGASKLMVVDPTGRRPLEHRAFADIVELLLPGTVLALNETRVVPARFLGKRDSGGRVEVLLVRPLADGQWEALIRSGGSLRPAEVLSLEDGRATLALVAPRGAGRWSVTFGDEDALAVAEACGRTPLPPYIKREATARDRETYQTVFARVPGAIAAPTSGLHFTPALLDGLRRKGVTIAPLVLHVGPGTFMPVRGERVEDHVLEAERYAIPPETAGTLQDARAEGRPVVACGTTCVRALEAFARTGEAEGATDLYVYPPFEFAIVDGMITNFHLPKSTLILLVAALAGRETILDAYREAVARAYRFYSYGDAMYIRP